MTRLTRSEVDALRFAVRADRQALSESARIEAAVEKILTWHTDHLAAHLNDAKVKNRHLRRKLRECRDGQP